MTLALGMVRPGSTILVPFHAFDSNNPSASVAIAAFVLADIGIYKATSMVERASTTGVVLLETDGIDIDSAVGIHGFSIDLSSNATAGFYAAGSHYYVTVGPITIDGAVVNFVAATFSIGYPEAIINTTIASVTNQTQFILTDGPAEADVLIGCPILFHDVASAVQLSIGYVTDYIVTTKEVICTDPGGFTFVATDNVSIMMRTNVHAWQGTTATLSSGAPDVNIQSTDNIDLSTLQKASVNTEADQALADYNGPTSAELVSEIDAVQTDISNLNNLSAAAVNAEVDTALLDYNGPTSAELVTEINAVQTDISNLNNLSAAAVNAEVDTALDTAISELSQGIPTATPTVRTALMLMYMALRNKLDVATSGTDTLEIHNNAGTRIAQKLLTDDGSDYSEAKMSSGA